MTRERGLAGAEVVAVEEAMRKALGDSGARTSSWDVAVRVRPARGEAPGQRCHRACTSVVTRAQTTSLGGSAPDDSEPGVHEGQDADGPEQRRRDGSPLALAAGADAEQGADDEEDHELHADLDVVEIVVDPPGGGEGEAGD